MSPSHWWVNSGASSLAVHAHPCGGGRRTGQHILPFEVFKATKVLVGDTLWLRLVNNQLSEGHTSWLLLPRGSTFVRVLGPGDEEQLIRMQWITRLLRPSYVGPPVLAWYCSGPSEVAIHAGPSSAPEAVGRLSAWQTFAAGEHVLGGEARNQMWARVEGEEGTSGGWVCISGDRRLGRVIELESDGVDLPLGQADVAIHNVWQRHGKACPLPLRSEPRLTAPPVQGALLHPGTVKIIDRAVFNADGQMWLRLRDSGLWVIRRSATDGQVAAAFCEGPWAASDRGRVVWYRNVFARSALPLRAAPALDSPAAHRVGLGSCLRGVDKVVNEAGHCFIGCYVEALGRVLWAIRWHAREGFCILKEIQPPGATTERVYRAVERLTAYETPGRGSRMEGRERELAAGQAFSSRERRLTEKGEMWVRVEDPGGPLWVPESAGGVVDSVVEVEGPVECLEEARAEGREGSKALGGPVDESSKLGLQVVTQADGEEEESELLREAFGTPKPRVQAGEKALLKDLDVFAEEKAPEARACQSRRSERPSSFRVDERIGDGHGAEHPGGSCCERVVRYLNLLLGRRRYEACSGEEEDVDHGASHADGVALMGPHRPGLDTAARRGYDVVNTQEQ